MIEKNEFDQVVGRTINHWRPSVYPPKTAMNGTYCTVTPLDIEAHAAEIFSAIQLENQGESWTYLPYGPFHTFAEFREWLSAIILTENEMYFSIIDKRTNKAVGMSAYASIDLNHGVIEVGHIHFSKLLKNTPAATEAMYLMMYRVFEELKFRRYQWRCNTLNKPSWSAAERLGFTFEGIFRQHNVLRDRNRDTAWFSILDGEWPVLKDKFQRWLSKDNFDENGCQIVSLKQI